MNRAVFALLAAALSGPALGAWEAVFRTGEATIYTESSQPSGTGTIRVRELWDYREPQDADPGQKIKSHRSQVFRADYDCRKATVRVLEIAFFAKAMGQGEKAGLLTWDAKDAEAVQPIKAATVADAIRKRVCR